MPRARLSGKVVKDSFGTGSKSEHRAVYLESTDGRFVLRRTGGNAFADAKLDALVGKTIEGSGELLDYTFLMDDWKVVPE